MAAVGAGTAQAEHDVAEALLHRGTAVGDELRVTDREQMQGSCAGLVATGVWARDNGAAREAPHPPIG
jgi:hypothetical protein